MSWCQYCKLEHHFDVDCWPAPERLAGLDLRNFYRIRRSIRRALLWSGVVELSDVTSVCVRILQHGVKLGWIDEGDLGWVSESGR